MHVIFSRTVKGPNRKAVIMLDEQEVLTMPDVFNNLRDDGDSPAASRLWQELAQRFRDIDKGPTLPKELNGKCINTVWEEDDGSTHMAKVSPKGKIYWGLNMGYPGPREWQEGMMADFIQYFDTETDYVEMLEMVAKKNNYKLISVKELE